MKIEFMLEKKKSNIEGKEIEYYVLRKTLITGDVVEIPIKSDKAKLIALSTQVEKSK